MSRYAALVALACSVAASAPGQQPRVSPAAFRTSAHFTKDQDVLSLSTAVAIVAPHPNAAGYTWLVVYFYAFPLTADDIAGASNGSVAALDTKRLQAATTTRERNLSKAALHLLIDKDSNVSNIAMEVPAVTCTIAVAAENVKDVLQEYRFDGRQVKLRGKGASVCNMESIGMGKPKLGWDVDVNIPVFVKR